MSVQVLRVPEPEPNELYPVLEAFRPILKSMDMRTIAVRSPSDGEWENLVTSIIVSDKPFEEVRSIQTELPVIRNKEIELFAFASSFDYSLFEFFCQGKIKNPKVFVTRGAGIGYGGVTIRTRTFDPYKLKVASLWKRADGISKRILSATSSNSAPEREVLWGIAEKQTGLPKDLGYKDMNDLLKSTLRIEDLSRAKDFELTISDLVKIENVAFRHSSFVVNIARIEGLKNLQLNVFQDRSEKGGFLNTVWRKQYLIDKIEAKQPKEPISIVVQPPNLRPYDYISLEVIHKGSLLTIEDSSSRAPLQNVVDPYFKMLDAFCPIAEFREMLLNPEKSSKKPDKRFENAVAWLLSLAGFHTIYLGVEIRVSKKGNLVSYDVLRNESGIPVGCADIIAYEDNERLLLVDCDIGGLNEQKIQKLVATRHHFESLLDCKELKIVPVLFSPKPFREAAMNKPVAIADGAVIESMLEDIAKGDREYARSKIWL